MKNIDDTVMGYVYISESLNNAQEIKNINTCKNPDLFFITFDTNLQDFDVENRNHRYYDGRNIWDCIMSEKIQSLLSTGGWFGEFEHPTPEKVGDKLSPERIRNVPPERRAFKIMKPKIVGNVLSASIQSAQGAVGEGFGKEVLAGWVPQFSCRAIASMINKNGKPYVMVKNLITYDAPWYPSHAIAHATSAPVVHSKTFTESVHDDSYTKESAVDIINGVMIPLKEILIDTVNKDVNAQMILESFDLGMDNLMGFSNDKKQILIKDENNIIYANLDPKQVTRVHEFYNSFR